MHTILIRKVYRLQTKRNMDKKNKELQSSINQERIKLQRPVGELVKAWSFRGITTPMGVATYNNIRIKDMLPTQEQLKERMELLQKEATPFNGT